MNTYDEDRRNYRRSRRYARRAFRRQYARTILLPAFVAWVIIATLALLLFPAAIDTAFLMCTFLGAGFASASVTWWQAERTNAIARQLYLDTRSGPLGER